MDYKNSKNYKQDYKQGNVENVSFLDEDDLFEELTYLVDEEKEEINLICNYNLAKELAKYYSEDDFNDYSCVNMASDEDLYYVNINSHEDFEIISLENGNNSVEDFDYEDMDKLYVLAECYADDDVSKAINECKNIKIVCYSEDCLYGENDQCEEDVEECPCNNSENKPCQYGDCEDCEYCNNDEIEEDDIDCETCEDCKYDELSEVQQGFIDSNIGILLKFGMNECEARCLLSDVYSVGYSDGNDTTLLTIRDVISNILEE